MDGLTFSCDRKIVSRSQNRRIFVIIVYIVIKVNMKLEIHFVLLNMSLVSTLFLNFLYPIILALIKQKTTQINHM